MDIKTLVNGGWSRHAKETEAVAAEFEQHWALAETNEHATALIQIANHTIGEHLRQWPRACALAEKILAGRADTPVLAGSFAMLAVAQYMANKPVDALASEAHAVRLTTNEKVGTVIQVRAMTGSALVFNRRTQEGTKVYRAAMQLARAHDGKLARDIALAALTHNLANELNERKDNGEPERALMLEAAEDSRFFWSKCGTWKNAERAEFLFALIYNRLGEADKALEYCAKGLEIIAASGVEPVDEAFFNLSIATAQKQKKNRPAFDAALARADTLAAEFDDDYCKTWFKEERAKVEW